MDEDVGVGVPGNPSAVIDGADQRASPGQGSDSMGFADLLEEILQHARELALSLFQAAEVLRRQPLRQRWIGIQMGGPVCWIKCDRRRARRLSSGAFLVGLV